MASNPIKQIWPLVSLTQADFKRIYVATVNNFLAVEHDQEVCEQALLRATQALKLRRGYMLPIGSDAETCYREQEIWTYAVFISSLMSHRWSDLHEVLPEITMAWIDRHPNVAKAIKAFEPDAKDAGNNVLIEIASLAKVVPQPSEPTEVESITALVKPKSKAKAQQRSLIDVLSHWLNAGVKNSTISVNEHDSFIHRIDLGVFLVLPACYEQFIKDNASSAAQIFTNQLSEKEFINRLLKDGHLVKANKGNVHNYFFGDWGQRTTFSGVVLSDIASIDALASVEINDQLKPEILS